MARRRSRRSYKRYVSPYVRRYVNTMIHRNIENKHLTSQFTNRGIQSAPNTGNLEPGNFIYLLPTLTGNGDTASMRIGNEIRLMTCNLKVRFNKRMTSSVAGSDFNPSAMPTLLKVFLFKVKNTNQDIPPDTDEFFDNGDQSLPTRNLVTDSMLSVNKELFTVKRQWTFKLGFANATTQYPQGTAPNQSFAATYPTNEVVYSSMININFNKYLKKKLRFNDDVGDVTNDNLWLMAYPMRLDGSGDLNMTLETPCEMHATIHYQWEDA